MKTKAKKTDRSPARRESPRPTAPADEQDELLDEALEETFPASDPIAPAHPRR